MTLLGTNNLAAQTHQLSLQESLELFGNSNFNESVPSLLFHKQSIEQSLEFDEEAYSNVIMALNYYYLGIGDLSTAKQICDDAFNTLDLRCSTYNNDLRRQLYLTIGNIEHSLKNYSTAESLLMYAKSLYEEANDYGTSYMVMLNELSVTYSSNGNLLMAKLYMDEFIEYYEKTHGTIFDTEDEYGLLFLNNYGTMCYKMGKIDEAEHCWTHVLSIGNKKRIFSHDVYMFAFTNLVGVYFIQNRYNELINLIDQTDIEAISSSINSNLFLQELIYANLFVHHNQQAELYLNKLNQNARNNIINNVLSFPEDNRENYWINMTAGLLSINNHVAFQTSNPKTIEDAYNTSLFIKNFDVNLSRAIRVHIQAADMELKKVYQEYKKTRNLFSYKANTEFARDSLIQILSNTEKLIMQSLGGKAEFVSSLTVSWEDIRDNLNDDEIAIEFCVIPILDSINISSKQYYGAYILKKDYNSPQLIQIGRRDSIDALFSIIDSSSTAMNELYQWPESNVLYHNIWGKLLPYLKNVHTIFYSPTDGLAKVNMDALQLSRNKMMVSQYSMRRLSSTGMIPTLKQSKNNQVKTAILYGNINYDASIEEMERKSQTYISYFGTQLPINQIKRSSSYRGAMVHLPYSKIEIDSIFSTLKKNGINATVLTGSDANEESFKALDGASPDIIHLATHGFFIDTPLKAQKNNFTPTTNIYSNKEAFMMWTGLMMAGANNIWSGKFNTDAVEDGVLTADEISRLDLSGTKLVILSACETARGKVDPVDGVLGLQRALKKAGVKTIMISLWEVEDFATQLLMTEFYKNILSGKTKQESLKTAQKFVQNHKDENGIKLFSDPYYWASFILIDALD